MKILIIGATGQLGTELAKIILNKNSKLGLLSPLYDNAIVFHPSSKELDITNFELVISYFKENSFDIVFNCSALSNVELCETEHDLAYKLNAYAPELIAKKCAETGAKFVHFSTDYVFNNHSKLPFSETDLVDPQSVYGQSKAEGERLVLKVNPNALICRTSWLYGGTGKNFVNTILRLGKEKRELSVVDDQFGKPTCVIDLAYIATFLAVTSEKGIIHCTGEGEVVSWFTFAQTIIEEAGIDTVVKPCTSEEFPSKVLRPKYSALENRRLNLTDLPRFRDWRLAFHEWMQAELEVKI